MIYQALCLYKNVSTMGWRGVGGKKKKTVIMIDVINVVASCAGG